MCVCVFLFVQKQYRSDLNWMKGVGWEASQSLDVRQAKKAGELVSEVGTKKGEKVKNQPLGFVFSFPPEKP